MSVFVWSVKVDGGNVAGITLAGARITYGRRGVESRPTAGVAYLQLLTPDADPDIAKRFPDFAPGPFAARSGFVEAWEDTYYGVVSRLTIGASVEVAAESPSGFVEEWVDTYEGSQMTRFTGRITAIDYRPGTATITAVDDLERLGRVEDSSKWPAETDVARATRLAKLAGVDLVVDGDHRVNLVPRDNGKPEEPETAVDVLSALIDIATDAEAVLYADRDNVLRYRTRTAPSPAAVLLPSGRVVEDTLAMSLDLADVVNDVTVDYGPQTARLVATATDPDSVAVYGKRDRREMTQLADQADAQGFADRWVKAGNVAGWQVPEVEVALINADGSTIDNLAGVDIGTPITVTDLPIGGPVDKVTGAVLGYTENLDAADWTLTFHLTPTDYERAA